MFRHIKMEAIQKGRKDDDGEARKKTQEPVVTYERPEPWCKIDDFPPLLQVFNMDTYLDSQFVEKMLTLYKPRENDRDGYVYVL